MKKINAKPIKYYLSLLTAIVVIFSTGCNDTNVSNNDYEKTPIETTEELVINKEVDKNQDISNENINNDNRNF